MQTRNQSQLSEHKKSTQKANIIEESFDIGALLPYPEIRPDSYNDSFEMANAQSGKHKAPQKDRQSLRINEQEQRKRERQQMSQRNEQSAYESGTGTAYPEEYAYYNDRRRKSSPPDTSGQDDEADADGSDSGSDGKKGKSGGRSETAAERPDGSVTTKHAGVSVRTITIAGQIEGHIMLPQGTKATRYELIIPQIVEIEEASDTDALLLIINTVGGDVEAGLALSELISGMKKPTASLVLGGGHSIGVPLAVCTDRSFIVPTATMTLHPVRISGLVLGAPQTSVMFTRMQERIVSFVCSHSRLPAERFRELMLSNEEMTTDLGTILDGKQAVDEGLIDSIGGLSDALGYLEARVKGLKTRGKKK